MASKERDLIRSNFAMSICHMAWLNITEDDQCLFIFFHENCPPPENDLDMGRHIQCCCVNRRWKLMFDGTKQKDFRETSESEMLFLDEISVRTEQAVTHTYFK